MLFVISLLERLSAQIAQADEAGQGLVEYSLLLVFVVVIAIVAVTGLGSTIVSQLGDVTTSLQRSKGSRRGSGYLGANQ